MRFIYLDNGAIYCRWGKNKDEWFMVFDPAYHRSRWVP